MLRKSLNPAPHWLNWSGFMQHVFTGAYKVDEDDVTILPLIDLNPSDETTLYSCILFIEFQVEKLKLTETMLTFGQPIYINSEETVRSKNIKSVVIRSGSFHTLMSAVGAIFSVMKGSGIDSALGCAYGPNTIIHMMSGKAIARALCGLFLLDAGLSHKLIEFILPQSGVQTDNNSDQDPFASSRLPSETYNELQSLVSNCLDAVSENSSEEQMMDIIMNSEALVKLQSCLAEVKDRLCEMSRTAKLWLQFMEHVAFISDFISCERLKSWEGHLNAHSPFSCFSLLMDPFLIWY